MRVVESNAVHELAIRLWSELGGSSGHCVAGGSCWRTVRGFIEYTLELSIDVVRVPVESWRGKAHLDPSPAWSVALPLQLSGHVEGAPVWLEGDPSEPSAWLGGGYKGRVVVARFPESPDDLKAAALLAADNGASALLLESPVPRIIVGTGFWGYSFHAGAPMPLPVVVVPEGYASSALRAGRVSVTVEASLEDNIDYVLVAVDGDPSVFYGAHHDSWFHGFSDNVLGIIQAASAFSQASYRGRGAGLLVFPAEEHGAPGAASWYWAWGSRYYARLLEASEREPVYVNFDVAGVDGCLKVSGAPQLLGSLNGLGLGSRPWECPECDSMSLAMAGLATVSLHSLWCNGVRRIYHTPLDTPDAVPRDTAALAVEAALKASLSEPEWSRFQRLLEEVLGKGPLLARHMLYRILSIAARVGWPSLYRELARRFLKPVHLGSYRYDTGDLEALWFPSVEAYKRVLRSLEEGRPPLEVWISGEERLLYVTGYTPKGSLARRESLASQFEANARRDLEELDEMAHSLLS